MEKKKMENKLEDLLGRYWELAYKEGKFSQFQSYEANLVLSELKALFKLAMGSTLKQCPTCQRGDVWQEAVSRTEYVYSGELVQDGQEVINYLLAEVGSILDFTE